jgi:hypothetical protein
MAGLRTTVAVVVAALLLSLLAPRDARADPIFADEFNGAALDPAWTVQNVGSESAYLLSEGQLILHVAKGSDQWAGVNRAPKLLKAQPDGDWTIETKITADTGNHSTFPGLVVYKDAASWLIWGWVSNYWLEASGMVRNSYQQIGAMATKYPYIRVRKAGNDYLFDASDDGVNWTNANVFTDANGVLNGARVGLIAKDWNRPGALPEPSYSVKFDYYREHAGDAMPSLLKGATSQWVATETGASSINKTHTVADVCGTDLGIMFDWRERTYITFGDTKSCKTTNQFVRSNTLAFSSDTDPADGLTFDGWVMDERGGAKEIIPEDIGGTTAIPSSAIAVGDRAYIYYMNVSNWGRYDGFWLCNFASLASADAPDDGTWRKWATTISWSPGDFNQLAVVRGAADPTTLYVFATPCGRYGAVKLMKVDQEKPLDKAAYSYFAGFDANGPVWSPSELRAVNVAGGPSGELSIRYDAALERYLMSYLDSFKSGIVVRESPNPWGPWSAPVVVARTSEYPSLYGSFMKTGFGDGATFYFIMSRFDLYNAFWMKGTLTLPEVRQQ